MARLRATLATEIDQCPEAAPTDERGHTELSPTPAWAAPALLDAEGRPLVLFHGTFAEFATFEAGHRNGWTIPRAGFYFTDDHRAAAQFGPVRAHCLALQQPADFREASSQAILDAALDHDPAMGRHVRDAVADRYGAGGPLVRRVVHMGLLQTDAMLESLRALGYDGMIFFDDFGDYAFTSYVAFDATLIHDAPSPRREHPSSHVGSRVTRG